MASSWFSKMLGMDMTLDNLQSVLIDLGCIGPAIQPAGNLIDEPLVTIGVEPLSRDTCGPGLGVGEGGR